LGAKKTRENTTITRTYLPTEMLTKTTVTTGDGAKEAPKIECIHDLVADQNRRTNRPVVFLLLGGTDETKKADEAIDDLLNDERVRTTAITSCIVVRTVSGAEIDESHPFGKWLAGGELPRMVIFSAGHEKVGVADARTTPTACYEMLAKAIALDFDIDVDTRVREFGKRWSRITNLEDRITMLDETLALKAPNPPKVQVRKRDELAAQLETETKEIALCYEMVPRKGSAADKGS
jgi:hypothetical protein